MNKEAASPFWKFISSALICIFFSVVGIILGAYTGGNYLEDLALFGVRGYEAAWPLGLILGLMVGVLISKRLLWRKRDPGPANDNTNDKDSYL